jgi:plastocyanin
VEVREKARTSFRRRSRAWVVASSACLVIALAACGGNSNNPPAASGPKHTSAPPSPTHSAPPAGPVSKTITGQQVNFVGSANVSKKSSIEIHMENFFFSPTMLKGKPGQSVTIELKNEGSVPHNFTLPSQHINQDVQVGQKTEVKVTFPQSGTVLWHCRFHQFSGMRGALQAG